MVGCVGDEVLYSDGGGLWGGHLIYLFPRAATGRPCLVVKRKVNIKFHGLFIKARSKLSIL